MARIELRFDATTAKISTREKWLDLEITTDYPDEVLNCFSSQEIVDDFENLKELYELLKNKFQD
jgi:hypothetical protein